MTISPDKIVLIPNAIRVQSEINAIDNQFKNTDWVLENQQTGLGIKAGLFYWSWGFEHESLNSIDREEIKNLYKEAGWTDVEIICQSGGGGYSIRLYTDKHIC